ncbi:MAG: helix-turn-helix domain-containing protein [Actinobacteria bacterium]|nr:helix-turn-helix domain-containing protein [Actinomycetota bacterium]
MEFGKRLRELRERAGYTQAELAEGIAASSYISLLEAGKRKPKLDLVIKLSDRLGVSSDELLVDSSMQEISLNLNTAKVALSSGDLEIAKEYAERVLSSRGVQHSFVLAASVVLLQVKARQGSFDGVLDKLEILFKDNFHAEPDVLARIGNEIVRVCFRSGNLGMGVQRGEEFLRNYSSRWPDNEVVELLCQLGNCHFHRGDTARAGEIVTRALQLAEKCRSPKAMVQSYWQSSVLAESRGDLTLALSQITQAVHWSKIAELHQVLPILNDNAAKIMLDLPNPNYTLIKDLAESAYLDLTAQNNPGHAAYTCITLSEVAFREGNMDKALAYVQQGLAELPKGIPGPKASLYSQEAKVLFRLGRVEESKAQLENAISHMSDMAPSKELAIYWGEVARVYVEIGLPDKAIYAYEQAISVKAASQAEQEFFANASL